MITSMPWYFGIPVVGMFVGILCGIYGHNLRKQADAEENAYLAREAARRRENAYAAGPIAKPASVQLYDIAWQVSASGAGGPATANFSATVPRQFKL